MKQNKRFLFSHGLFHFSAAPGVPEPEFGSSILNVSPAKTPMTQDPVQFSHSLKELGNAERNNCPLSLIYRSTQALAGNSVAVKKPSVEVLVSKELI